MAEFEKHDFISDEALNAPIEFRDALNEIVKVLDNLVKKGKEFDTTISKASSSRKIVESTNELIKSQRDLDAVQKRIITSSNEVAEAQKREEANLRKTGTAVSDLDKKMASAANAATALGGSQRQASKASQEANKSYIAEAGSLEALIQKRDALKRFIEEEKQSQKEEAEALKQGLVTRAEYNETLTVSAGRILEFQNQLKVVNKDISTHIQLEGRDAKAITAKNASLRQLEAALNKNRAAWANLTTEEQRNSKEGQALLKIIQEQDKESKALSASIGQSQKEVGSYTEAIKAALGPVQGFTGHIAAISPGLGAAGKAMIGAARGANILKVALVAIPIFAIITAITSLINYFKGTEEGAERLRIILAAVGQVFASIRDVSIDMGKAIFEALSNPKQLLIDIGNIIKDQVMNRFTGFWDLLVAIFDGAAAGFTLLQEKIKSIWGGEDQERIEKAEKTLADAGKRALESYTQTLTGIDNFTDKVVDGFNAAKEAVKEFARETSEEVKRAIELQELENLLIRQKRQFLVREAGLQKDIAEAREDAADQTKTEEERLEASIRARELINTLEQERLSIADRELFIARERAKLSHSSEEDLEHIAQLEADRLDIIAQRAQAERFLTRQITGLQLAIIERDKQAALLRIENIQQTAKRETEIRLHEKQRELDGIEALIRNEARDGLITRTEAERRIQEVRRKFALQITEDSISQLQKALEAEIKFTEEKLKVANLTEKERVEIEQESADVRAEIEKKLHALRVKLNKDLFEQDNDYFENLSNHLGRISEEFQKWAGGISDLFSSLTDARIANLEKEQRANERFREELLEGEQKMADEQLAREGLTTEQRDAIKASSRLREAEINDEFDKKQEALEKKKIAAQRRQAIFDKAVAVTQAIINTAQAVTATLAQFGFPIGVPFAAAVGALGAIQVASILARPIPQYEKGGTVEHTGPIVVGEKGSEMMVTPHKDLLLTPSHASVVHAERGTEVIPHRETMRRLAESGLHTLDRRPVESDKIDKRLISIENTIRNKKEVTVIGRIVGYKKAGTRATYIESLRNR